MTSATSPLTRLAVTSLLTAVLSLVAFAAVPRPPGAGIQRAGRRPLPLRVEISFPASAHAQPITGRVYVMISRTADREPRLQIGRTGVPFFGRDVEHLKPGQVATIDETALGSPVDTLRDIPAGDYYV